jgi:hypothetical protein
MSNCARALHKARSLIDAPNFVSKARKDSADKGLSAAERQDKAVAATPEYLKGRVAPRRPLPRVEFTPQRLTKTPSFAEVQRAAFVSV